MVDVAGRNGQRHGAAAVLVVVVAVACGGRSISVRDEPAEDDAGRGGDSMSTGGSGGSGVGGRGTGGSGGATGGTGGRGSFGGAGGRGVAGASGSGVVGGAAGAGGSPMGGGSGGTAGRAIQPEALFGDYDVHFSTLPSLDGCRSRLSSSRMNLQIDTLDGFQARAFQSFGFDFVKPGPPKLDDRSFELPSGSFGSVDAFWVPSLHLNVRGDGFAGDGWAYAEYECTDGPSTVTVDVKVVPDETSPVLRVVSTLPTGTDLFPFSSVALDLSEPVVMPSGAYDDDIVDLDDAASTLAFVDSSSGEELPLTWYTGLSGPAVNGRFPSMVGLAGRTLYARTLAPLPDRAGHPTMLDGVTYLVQEPAELGDLLSFDELPPAGVFGAATWFAPDDPTSPCESGGCLALDGAGYGCTPDFTRSPAYVALSLGEQPPAGVRIRYRILYVDETDATVHLFQHYPSDCVGYKPDSGRHVLPEPVNGFAYGTDWITTEVGFCAGPIAERGMLFALGCESAASTPPNARLVIEWIEPVDG